MVVLLLQVTTANHQGNYHPRALLFLLYDVCAATHMWMALAENENRKGGGCSSLKGYAAVDSIHRLSSTVIP
jgi:hypothetical protein